MTERQALLASIIATPEDDAPRLVYADWLDENGEETWASFIRWQVKYKFTSAVRYGQSAEVINGGLNFCPDGVHDWFRAHTAEFAEKHPTICCYWSCGFVREVQSTAADCLAHMDTIVAEHPVQTVRLTTEVNLAFRSGNPCHVYFSGLHCPGGRGIMGIGYPYAAACIDGLKKNWPSVKTWETLHSLAPRSQTV